MLFSLIYWSFLICVLHFYQLLVLKCSTNKIGLEDNYTWRLEKEVFGEPPSCSGRYISQRKLITPPLNSNFNDIRNEAASFTARFHRLWRKKWEHLDLRGHRHT